jgi:3-deoxy-D-arabino-heptulosonate 7-phosphate (DAHP) synthase class II
MKTIIIGFSSHSSLFSWLIRFFTSSKVSHTYIRLPVPEYNTSVIFQASGLAVNYTASDVFESHSEVIEEYELNITDEQYRLSEKFRVTEVGKPYSYKQIIGFLTVLTARKFGKNIPNPLSNGDHSYVCVEVVANSVGISNGESMTPEDLRFWCQNNAKLVYKKTF